MRVSTDENISSQPRSYNPTEWRSVWAWILGHIFPSRCLFFSVNDTFYTLTKKRFEPFHWERKLKNGEELGSSVHSFDSFQMLAEACCRDSPRLGMAEGSWLLKRFVQLAFSDKRDLVQNFLMSILVHCPSKSCDSKWPLWHPRWEVLWNVGMVKCGHGEMWWSVGMVKRGHGEMWAWWNVGMVKRGHGEMLRKLKCGHGEMLRKVKRGHGEMLRKVVVFGREDCVGRELRKAHKCSSSDVILTPPKVKQSSPDDM